MTQPNENLDTRIPVTGLWDAALQAFLERFRIELADSEYGDIRPTHGCVFRFVREDGMRLTRLAELAGITKQSAGEIVDDLAKRGYVERVPDPADKRAKLICLTDRGREAQATGFSLFATVERQWIERYGAERWEAMRALLEEIVAAEAPDSVPELEREELADLNLQAA
ncbi:MAG TPA: MarR family transcriptional regulator [Solirubrobacterales bacterium]|nr:MarR family transcriptional regulator [Solirubrobacterales bacterium]